MAPTEPAPDPPPQGWATPPREGDPSAQEDLAALLALLQALRGVVPPELQHQLEDVIRQVLLLVRALIDRWLEHLDGERGAEPEVEDIPIS